MLQFAGIVPESRELRIAMTCFDPVHKQTTADIYAQIPNITEVERAFGVKIT